MPPDGAARSDGASSKEWAPAFSRHLPRGKRLWGAVGFLLLLAGLSGYFLYQEYIHRLNESNAHEPPPAAAVPVLDPPVPALSSPFWNTRPGVKYLGDAACRGCHVDISRAYHHHPMGRSLSRTVPGDGQETYPGRFVAGKLLLAVERRGEQVYHRVCYDVVDGQSMAGLPPAEAEVLWAIGSGAQGRSYLIDKEGFLFQSPISWYRHTHSWDLSPGYRERFRHFSRLIPFRCLFCHADGAEPVAGTINRYVEPRRQLRPIGCERCHGPGELHVAARKRGDLLGPVDYTIVNPRHLEPNLREAVCQQCHLQGEEAVVRRGRSLSDFRPGLPLAAFLSVFVRPAEAADWYQAVSHAEQMQVSRCYQGSGGKLGCISCHDPHQEPAPEQRDQVYRQACLRCHGVGDCQASSAVRQQVSDRCVACHMPRAASSNIAHAAVTDHRILRRPGQKPTSSGLRPGDIPLLLFPRTPVPHNDPELVRDLALAMVEKARNMQEETTRKYIAARALLFLEPAVRRAPGDLPAWEALAYAAYVVGRSEEALAAAEHVLARKPREELALSDAVLAALALKRYAIARNYAHQLLQVNPYNVDYQYYLARVCGEERDWLGCWEACRQALSLEPAHVATRTLLVSYYLAQGQRAAAQAEFDRILALDPPDKEERRRWFQELLSHP